MTQPAPACAACTTCLRTFAVDALTPEGKCAKCAMPPRTVYETVVVVKGIFGRNRTVKFKTFTVETREADNRVTDEEAIRAMRACAADIKLKSGYLAVEERPIQLEGIWKRYTLYSERKIHAEVL